MRRLRMLSIIGLSLMLLSGQSLALEILDCAQKQKICTTKCELGNIGDETKQSACKAKCLGERTRCSAGKGVEKAKELGSQAVDASKGALDKAKSFIDGLTEE